MKRIIAALMLALTVTAGVRAAEVKIAVIDMQKAFVEYEKTKTIEIKLNQQMEVFKEYSDQLNQQYQNLRKQYESARDDSQNIAFSGAERESKRLKAQQLYESLKLKEQTCKCLLIEHCIGTQSVGSNVIDILYEDYRSLYFIKVCKQRTVTRRAEEQRALIGTEWGVIRVY